MGCAGEAGVGGAEVSCALQALRADDVKTKSLQAGREGAPCLCNSSSSNNKEKNPQTNKSMNQPEGRRAPRASRALFSRPERLPASSIPRREGERRQAAIAADKCPACHVLLKEEISLSFEMTRRAENSSPAAPLVNQVAACVCVGGGCFFFVRVWGGLGWGLGRYCSSAPAAQYIYLE